MWGERGDEEDEVEDDDGTGWLCFTTRFEPLQAGCPVQGDIHEEEVEDGGVAIILVPDGGRRCATAPTYFAYDVAFLCCHGAYALYQGASPYFASISLRHPGDPPFLIPISGD